MKEDENYQLGEDITEQAAPFRSSGTSVLAIEISLEQLEALDTRGEMTGQSALEVARDAISYYVSTSGSSLHLGQSGPITKAAEAQLITS
jgi:hypothetical protein